jgi:hypothetical protein
MNQTLEKVLKFFGVVISKDGIIVPMTMVSTFLCKIAVVDGHFAALGNNTYKLSENRSK